MTEKSCSSSSHVHPADALADRWYRPLIDDGKPDIQAYNDELATLGSPTWFNVPWLFAECYLYRYSIGNWSTLPPNG